uniref:Uncharacterized protein n=1 Tax=Setaria digitata TaxID=48799 RepID=A0A915PTF0_9BILA
MRERVLYNCPVTVHNDKRKLERDESIAGLHSEYSGLWTIVKRRLKRDVSQRPERNPLVCIFNDWVFAVVLGL